MYQTVQIKTTVLQCVLNSIKVLADSKTFSILAIKNLFLLILSAIIQQTNQCFIAKTVVVLN